MFMWAVFAAIAHFTSFGIHVLPNLTFLIHSQHATVNINTLKQFAIMLVLFLCLSM